MFGIIKAIKQMQVKPVIALIEKQTTEYQNTKEFLFQTGDDVGVKRYQAKINALSDLRKQLENNYINI
jgi:co-chaperonin GroES (HSP10)